MEAVVFALDILFFTCLFPYLVLGIGGMDGGELPGTGGGEFLGGAGTLRPCRLIMLPSSRGLSPMICILSISTLSTKKVQCVVV